MRGACRGFLGVEEALWNTAHPTSDLVGGACFVSGGQATGVLTYVIGTSPSSKQKTRPTRTFDESRFGRFRS